jgi:hypothetical protein
MSSVRADLEEEAAGSTGTCSQPSIPTAAAAPSASVRVGVEEVAAGSESEFAMSAPVIFIAGTNRTNAKIGW